VNSLIDRSQHRDNRRLQVRSMKCCSPKWKCSTSPNTRLVIEFRIFTSCVRP